MQEKSKPVYSIEISPDPNGDYSVENERFRVYEETDPKIVREEERERVKRIILEIFAVRMREHIREGEEPERTIRYDLYEGCFVNG